jgi:hypothetical protein
MTPKINLLAPTKNWHIHGETPSILKYVGRTQEVFVSL